MLSEDEGVTTINTEIPSSITLLQYYSRNNLKYIPSEIFRTFPNMEQLYINNDPTQFSSLKSYYLKNANNLKVICINDQKMFTFLEANVFIGAPNLEYINLQNNALDSIHKLAFHGLPRLKGIYLLNNKIKNLHPSTFSHLLNLHVLDLLNNICISNRYENFKVSTVESEIRSFCSYKSLDELAEFESKLQESELIKKLEATIEELKKTLSVLKDHHKMELTNLSEQNELNVKILSKLIEQNILETNKDFLEISKSILGLVNENAVAISAVANQLHDD